MTATTFRLRSSSENPGAPGRRIEPSRLHPRDLLEIGVIGIRTRRVRSILTSIGIAIGIAAMVAVLAISESSRADLLASLDRLGTNLLTITPGQTFRGEAASLPLEAPGMVERIGPVDAVSTVGSVAATVRRTDLIPEGETGGISVLASDLDLLETLHGTLAVGTFLNDATERYPAVVLGATAADRLGIHRVNVTVWLGERWFTVVGILDPVELATPLNAAALVGYPVAASLYGHDGTASTIYVRSNQEAVSAVRDVLGRTANPENPTAVSVSRPSDALEARAEAATAFTELFLGLGAVALLVGGIGIANVMLMAVLERRNEIGLRRALGATRGHIALQFVAESLTFALLGGFLGVALGIVVSVTYATLQGWDVVIPLIAPALGLGSAVLVGALAGLYPSARAARVSPTEALRGT
jgi:putative ABC transport system permease protein